MKGDAIVDAVLAQGFAKVSIVVEREPKGQVWFARAMDPHPGTPGAELPTSKTIGFGYTRTTALENLTQKLGLG